MGDVVTASWRSERGGPKSGTLKSASLTRCGENGFGREWNTHRYTC